MAAQPDIAEVQRTTDSGILQSKNDNAEGKDDVFIREPEDPEAPVELKALKQTTQWINCPYCHRKTQTRWEGRSRNMQLFMDCFWFPLPNRRHWWETVRWYCTGCDKELASRKNKKPLVVTAPQGGAHEAAAPAEAVAAETK